MAKVIVVRHGDTEFSSEQKIGGWLDIPLTDKGEREAKALARRLKGSDIDVLYCSDCQSASETADIVGNHLDMDPKKDHRLRSWNLGKLAGQSMDKHHDTVAHLVDEPDEDPGHGETFSTYNERLRERFEEALEEAEDDDCTVCIITHSRNLRWLDAWYKAGMKDTVDPYLMTKKHATHPISTATGVVLTLTPKGWRKNEDAPV